MPILAVALALIGAGAPTQIAVAETVAPRVGRSDIVAVRSDVYDRLTVPVRIGEHGAFRFLVDTGSQNTVISAEIADRMALPARSSASLISVAGNMRVGTVTLNDLRLGRRSFSGLVAPLLRQEDIGADGIVGLDSLQDQRVLLDFGRGVIAIDDAALGDSAGFDIVVRARRVSGQLILTSARIDGVKVDVVIDTGTGVTVGNLALQAALHRRHAITSQSLLTSVTGQSIMADVGIARRLALGALQISNVAIAYADAPPFAALGLATHPAVLLGMRELRAFKRVAIDFSQRRVLFDVPDEAFAPEVSVNPMR